jgi:hypothetical protein
MEGPGRKAQDFLWDQLEGPIVFRRNRASVEQAFGQFVADRQRWVPVPLVCSPSLSKV